MRQCADGIRAHDATMIESLLKLGGGFRIPVRGQQRLAAQIGRVQTAKVIMIDIEAVRSQCIPAEQPYEHIGSCLLATRASGSASVHAARLG